MTTLTMITVGAVGFALGLYVSSQIMGHITSRTSNEKLLDNINEYEKSKRND
tara:strand:- start:294 stop:449 length:156 start_codon:yes stop_codon:yes gene_type:complete